VKGKRPLLRSTSFLPNIVSYKNGGLTEEDISWEKIPGNILITFVFPEWETERRASLMSPRACNIYACLKRTGTTALHSFPKTLVQVDERPLSNQSKPTYVSSLSGSGLSQILVIRLIRQWKRTTSSTSVKCVKGYVEGCSSRSVLSGHFILYSEWTLVG
jgi:hypothetical protein